MIKATFAFVTLALGGALAFGCGSDSGSGAPSKSEFISICKRFCQKSVDCAGGSVQIDCASICSSQADATYKSGKPAADCDFDKVKAKIDECVSGTCSDLETCASSVDGICPSLSGGGDQGTGGASGNGGSSSGTGGSSSGTGGKATGGSSTGTGGGSSSGDCSVCGDAETCCKSAASQVGEDPTQCDGTFTTACAQSTGSNKSQLIDACQQLVDSYKASGLCK